MQNIYNLAFERAILSNIIFSIDASHIEETVIAIKSDFFYLPAHRDIFEAMETLLNSNKPIDEEFLKIELDKRKKFDESVMLDIMSANPIANIKSYIDQVKEYWSKRKLIDLSSSIKNAVIEENNTSDITIAKIDAELMKIVDADAKTSDFGIIAIDDVEDGQTEFILQDWLPIPRGTVTLISAPGGTGKSWTALQMAIRHALDGNHKCAVWLSEDPLFESKTRATSICRDILHTSKSLHNIRLVAKSPIQLIVDKKFLYASFYKFKKNFAEDDLIIFDPTLAFYGGDENDNSQARMFMQPFMDWARDTNKCIVFLHHSKKSSDGVGSTKSTTRGAGAFVDAARTVYDINKPDDIEQTSMREFVLTKDNYGVIKHLKSFKVKREITPKPVRCVVTEYENVSMDYEKPKQYMDFGNEKLEITIL